LIHAVASGKKAARFVYRYLADKAITTQTFQAHYSLDTYRREEGYEGIERAEIPTEDVRARLKDPKRSVEKAYSESTASTEASRCLRCNVNTIFDGARCILCGGCADVCPQRCFKLVPLEALDLTTDQQAVAIRSLGEDWHTHTAIIKDEEACIRCGLCAERCPTNAISMERMEFSEAWS